MRKVLFQSLMILLLNASFFAQTESNDPNLIDEFGAMPLDELMARLDSAVYQSQDKSGGKLNIRIYGGIANSFMSAYYRGSFIEAYFKNRRKVSPERFSIEYCNVNKEDFVNRIYIARQGEPLPKCETGLELPAKTTEFASVYFYSPEFNFIADEDSVPEFGFSQGNYSRNVFNILKSFLEKSPEHKVYVVSYLRADIEKDDNGKVIRKKIDKKSLAPKMLQSAKNKLIKDGFNTSQIELINGGYLTGHDVRHLEFWFVPKNGEIPTPKPDYFPEKKLTKKK